MPNEDEDIMLKNIEDEDIMLKNIEDEDIMLKNIFNKDEKEIKQVEKAKEVYENKDVIPKKIAAIEIKNKLKQKITVAIVSIIGFLIIAGVSPLGVLSQFWWKKWTGAFVAGILSAALMFITWNDRNYIKYLENTYDIGKK